MLFISDARVLRSTSDFILSNSAKEAAEFIDAMDSFGFEHELSVEGTGTGETITLITPQQNGR